MSVRDKQRALKGLIKYIDQYNVGMKTYNQVFYAFAADTGRLDQFVRSGIVRYPILDNALMVSENFTEFAKWLGDNFSRIK